MPVCTAEPSVEEVLRTLPGDCDARSPASEAKYVEVVVLHPLACRKVIVTERGSNANNLVGSHRGPHAAATHKNTPIYLTVGNSAGERDGKIGIVVASVIDLVAKIDDIVALFLQQLHEL
jgi:hypothetical protein